MQPPGPDVAYKDLERLWQSFMSDGRLDPRDLSQLDPVILRSWQRCVSRFNPHTPPRLAPIGDDWLAARLRTQRELLDVATPAIEDIHQFTEGSQYAIALTDGAACVLCVGGDSESVADARRRGLSEGVYWSEESAGTTAFGLALLDAMPVQVAGSEHYFAALHDSVTAAAPIHDIHGRIIGLLGMLGPLSRASVHTLGLVMSAARAISNQLQADWYLHEANQRLSEVNTILGSVSEGVIVWNQAGEVSHINPQAARMLSLNPRSVLGHGLSDIMPLPPELIAALDRQETLEDVELTFMTAERDVRCLVSVRPIYEATGSVPFGYAALLNPIEHVRQIAQWQYGARPTSTIEDIQAESTTMRRVVRQARAAARGLAPALLRGEGGVGKNLLARAIHNDGARASRPFLDINCRAIPIAMMAREILGQELDTLTQGQPSKFELADGGTVFLDQIENLSLELQAAVLQVIETRHVMRLGSSLPIPVDVRIIASTTADLEQLVAEGAFMPHLYYRFGVFNIQVPPLRERVDDIPLLAESFLARRTEVESRAAWIDDQAVEILKRYPWPGNVRELESALERAMNQSKDGIIRPVDLPESVRQGRLLTEHSPLAQPVLSVVDAEREAILRAGWACGGRPTEMARILGISRTTLWRKFQRHNLSPQFFRA